MTEAALTVFVRSGCHLCEEMLRDLEPWRREVGFELQVVDIDGDAALEAKYGARVPVLAGGENELCQFSLDEHAVRQYFGGR
ncbi:MAG: glutaredoxin family protein [Pseudomonadota bacterium]|nr:MAG: glutaredoxin family protein [Pseudomonadota bacterium]